MIFAFHRFELDVKRYELRRSGRRVKLQRVPMDLLILLVEQRASLVTRQAIEQRLWPDGAGVEAGLGINTAVRKVRQALGDNADRPLYVETVVGKGYRFIAVVEERTGEAAAPGSAAASAPHTDRVAPARRAGFRRIALAGLAMAMAAFLIVIVVPAGRSIDPLRISPFTALDGAESDPAFSPDGERVAFAWPEESSQPPTLHVKTVRTGVMARLTAGAGADSNPSWSPRGDRIAFLRRGPGATAAIYVIPAAGGPERMIADLKHGRAFRPAWSPDGESLAIEDTENSGGSHCLFLVSIASGERRRLTQPPPGSAGDSAPAFSPDGRTLAFLRNQGGANASAIYTMTVRAGGLPSGEPRRVPTDRVELAGLEWSADGKSLICPSASGLVRIPRTGGAGVPLPFPDAASVSVSRSGRRLIYSQRRDDTDIFRIAGPSESGAPARWIGSTRLDGAPKYSPDGQRIVFISDRTGAAEVWVADSQGRHAVPVTSFGRASAGSPRWSPDGRWIAFDSTIQGLPNIFVVSGDGGPVTQVTEAGASVRPSWSHDGEWIYYGSNGNGEWEVWKKRRRGGAPVRVTSQGGREAFEDADGRYLYYTKARTEGIWRMPVGGGPEELACDRGVQGRWAIGVRGVYYLQGQNGLEMQEFETGRRVAIPTPGLVLPIDPGVFGSLLGVGPADRWILVSARVASESDLMLVENFR